MLELTIEVLDPYATRFQLIIAAIIALIAIIFTIVKSMLAEGEASRQKKIMEEMREYKDNARKKDERKRIQEMKKWLEGEDWPVSPETKGEEKKNKAKRKKKKDGGGDG